MALFTCPECKKQISSTIDKCIHCGYSIDPEVAAKKVAENEKAKKTLGVGCLLIVILFAVLIYRESREGSNAGIKPKPVSPANDIRNVDASAVYACREMIRVLDDTQSGVLNETDLKNRMQKIYDEYYRLIDGSKSRDVKEGMRNFLVAINKGTTKDGVLAVEQILRGCKVK